MTSQQGMLDGFDPPRSRSAEIARVLVDVDLPHMDRPLDYVIPDKLIDQALVGCSVRVRFSGSRVDGWIVERVRRDDLADQTAQVESVSSSLPVLPPTLYETARRIGARFLATTSQVLSLAIPPRHARGEKAVLTESAPAWPHVDVPVDSHAWSSYSAGPALLAHLATGESPRAVVTALRPALRGCLADAVASTVASGRSVIVITATGEDAVRYARHIEEDLGVTVAVTGSEVTAEERYRVHASASLGRVPVVVGTRSAVWVPCAQLGLVVICDDGDDRLRERRFPRCDALDVAVQRCAVEKAGLLVLSHARSVKAQALVRSGWAASLDPLPGVLREATPRVHLHGASEAEREGASGHMRIPQAALRMIRQGLREGPVLIQVAASGYWPTVVCRRCGERARCRHCSGPLGVGSGGEATCSWCARTSQTWRCPHCSGTELRAARVGSTRTAEEIARNLPDASVLESSAAHRISRQLPSRPTVVVATPGAEPDVDGGYAAAIILDAHALAGRAELWAPEEAARRWLNALSLVRPGHPGLVVGTIPDALGQTLVRWAPTDYADRLLDEREALGFFPATTMVALDGPAAQVRQVAEQVIREGGAELVGTVVRPATREGEENEVRTLVRTPLAGAASMLAVLTDIRRSRSARKVPLVKMSVNPPELF